MTLLHPWMLQKPWSMIWIYNLSKIQQTKFYPWILNSKADMDSLSLPALHGVDTLNNIERIDVEIPVAGEYTIRISGQKIITENQAFSLTWGISPFEQFSWTFPTGSDILENGTSYLARW